MKSAPQRILLLKVCLSLVFALSYSTLLISADNQRHPIRKLASDSSEYISIDNGVEEDYFDGNTRTSYHADKGFITTGNVKYSDYKPDSFKGAYFERQLKTRRSFFEGKRNCYSLKPKGGKGSKYHITALFGGPYPGVFDSYIGVNYWDTVNWADSSIYVADAIFFATSDIIDVCLVKTTATDIPFFSLLELRLLKDPIYRTASYPTAMALKKRKNLGMFEHDGDYVRYIDDIYSRVWYVKSDISFDSNNPSVPSNTSVVFNTDGMKDDFKLPRQVLSTAVCALDKSSSLDITEHIRANDDDQFILYLHFFEFEEQAKDQNKRIMNISFNGESILQEPLTLPYWQPITIFHNFSGNSASNDDNVQIQILITSTSGSHFPAMLNAYEIYRVFPQLNLTTAQQDAEAMWNIKRTYEITKISWQGDPCVPTDMQWEGLTCNLDDIPRIISLDLNSSNLRGEIAASFANLTKLQKLDLSNNQLTGHVPEFFANLSDLNFLGVHALPIILDLTKNHLTDSLPKTVRIKADNGSDFRFDGNPGLCQQDSCPNESTSRILIAGIIGGIVAFLVIIMIIVTIIWWLARKKRVARKIEQLKSKNQVFSYAEILRITDNFRTVIGKGGFGNVYLGTLQDFTQVAVKLLSKSSKQGYREFQAEAQLLMVVHHKNLVPLIGYCDEGDIKALVFEYMIMGNLQQHLSDKNSNILEWKKRLQIALDAAHGLDYLHNGCKPPIVHRDLKPSNILLNEDMQSKIADFGLSKTFTNDIDTHISTRPAGTVGYLDPEFHRTGNLTKKSDVYSFGIILLELLTGQPAVIEAPSDYTYHILRWISPKLESKDIQDIVDSRLQGMFNPASAWKFVEVAMSCTSSNAIERPDIAQIVSELNECLVLEITTENASSSSSKSSIKSLETSQHESEIESHGM